MSDNPKYIDLSDFRARIGRPEGRTHGRRLWRSIDELAQTPEFRDLVHREFPKAASEWDDGVSRRNFIKLMGASIALAGVTTACGRRPEEKIVPYVQQPEQLVPGRPLFYASAMPFGGFGKGVLVEQHEGRPTKIEGNPDHPASLGATDVWGQASILNLYDPDRSQDLTRHADPTTWGTFVDALRNFLAYEDGDARTARRTRPARVRLLTETITSPTLTARIEALRAAVPDFKWYAWDPVGRSNAREGARLAFGQDLTPVYHFDRLKEKSVVVSLDANFLLDDPGSLRYARQYIDLRRVRHDNPKPRARLYVVESTPTIVGAMADEKVRVLPQRIAEVARLVQRGLAGEPAGGSDPAAALVKKLVKDLKEAGAGNSIVLAGEYQPKEVHAAAHAINVALGNVGDGKPVTFIKPVETSPAAGADQPSALMSDMASGATDMVIILGANPAYTSPADLSFATALEAFSKATDGTRRKNFTIHLGLYNDETAALCQWHVPETHFLEAWGDVRAFDGTASVIQPLIAPLYAGNKSAIELVSELAEQAAVSAAKPGAAPATLPALPGTGYDMVRATWRDWQTAHGGGDFEAFWYNALLKGVIAGSEQDFPQQAAAPAPAAATTAAPASAGAGRTGVTVIFRPDPNIWDGCFANNGWLQETPKPLSKLTWDNAVLMSPATALKLGLASTDKYDENTVQLSEANEKLVDLKLGGQSLGRSAPVWVLPGHPDDCVTLYLGYGRTRAGRVGSPTDDTVGFNAYAIRGKDNPWFATGLEVTPAKGTYRLACTQNHQVIDHENNHRRELVLYADSIEELHEERATRDANMRLKPLPLTVLPDDPARTPYSMYSESPDHRGGHVPGFAAWGMVIDQSACIGCNACVVACTAENNIPVVGKDQVLRGRQMQWLRIDTYYEGEAEDPDHTLFQPMACVHCEKAPCEVVCPVGATTHSKEGLNEMTYNRCVGTRYCSNNCPWKVRRFNFLQYSDMHTPVLKLLRNPEVSVRQRGVMEKCTYCVQRINRARIEAKKANEGRGRPIADGDVITACAQACPTQAIIFGDSADPRSKVYKTKQEPLGYHYWVLEELATRPRTSYLGRILNPAEGGGKHREGGGGGEHAEPHAGGAERRG